MERFLLVPSSSPRDREWERECFLEVARVGEPGGESQGRAELCDSAPWLSPTQPTSGTTVLGSRRPRHPRCYTVVTGSWVHSKPTDNKAQPEHREEKERCSGSYCQAVGFLVLEHSRNTHDGTVSSRSIVLSSRPRVGEGVFLGGGSSGRAGR